MDLELRDGDYIPDGVGGLRRVGGREALLQNVLFRLTAQRDAFPFWPELGSRLRELGRFPASERLSAARQFVAEALEDEPVSILAVELSPLDGGAVELMASLEYLGEPLAVTVNVQGVL